MYIESSTVMTVMFEDKEMFLTKRNLAAILEERLRDAGAKAMLWIGPSNNGFSILRFQVPGSMEGYREIVREFAKEYGEAS